MDPESSLERELCTLSARIGSRISDLDASAAAALAEVATLRDTLEARLADLSPDLGANARRNLEARCDELCAEILRAKAEKTVALESELVAADAAIERAQTARDAAGESPSVIRASVLEQYGPPPFEPAQPATLLLVPAPNDPEAALLLATLCAPGSICVKDVGLLPDPTCSWATPGALVTLSVSTAGDALPPPGAHGALAAAWRKAFAHSLVARLRISADIHPAVATSASLPSFNLCASPDAVPVAVPATIELSASGEDAVVRLGVPPAPSLPPSPTGLWLLRLGHACLGGADIDLGSLATGVSISDRPPHHKIRPEDEYKAQCLICPACFHCTGYGAGCCMASRQEYPLPPEGRPRPELAGKPCGCGVGTPGCRFCAMCKGCCAKYSVCHKAPLVSNV